MTAKLQPAEPGVNSNTVPLSKRPPLGAVPYRFPAASKIKLPLGDDPSVPSKLCSVVTAHLPFESFDTSKTDPTPLVPPPLVTPERFPFEPSVSPVHSPP